MPVREECQYSDRIDFELPIVPYALRAFVERAVRDDRVMMAFVENPGVALQAAGVPFDRSCLKRSDTNRLRDVLGRLRNMVADGRLHSDFQFEDIFTVVTPEAYMEQHSSSESYAYTQFDHGTGGQSAENHSRTEGGIKADFGKAGVGRLEDIFAPLLSPGDLATIAAIMRARIEAVGMP